jgi:hypothetical protein
MQRRVNTKQIATSNHEVVAILVTGGSADIMVGVYDTATGDINSSGEFDAIFVGANQGRKYAILLQLKEFLF